MSATLLAHRPVSMQELYPPAVPTDLRELVRYLDTGSIDEQCRAIIRRPLERTERQQIVAHLNALQKWLEPGPPKELAKALSEMFLGFGGRDVSADEAKMIVAQYTAVLKGRPLWAVQRACARFANGQVQPAEIGEQHFSKAYRPSSAHIAIVTDKLLEQHRRERQVLSNLLDAVPERVVEHKTPEERAEFIDRTIAKMKVDLSEADKEEKLWNERKRKRETELRLRAQAERVEEYRRSGVEPPQFKGSTVSLPLLLKMGWTIEELDGRKVLVSPGQSAR